MKKFLLLSCAVLFVLSGCKKEGSNTKITSLEFKKGLYEIYENDGDMNMKKELVAAPDGILDKEKIAWTVSDEEVAQMNGNFLSPMMPGDVKVTATVQGMSATCKVSVLPVQVEKITLNSMEVPLYGSKMIDCTTEPTVSMKRISFSSSSDDIAYVDYDGTVYGKGVGKATITAEVDGKKATCEVTVKKINVTKVEVTPKAYRFAEVGETLQLTATITPSDASVKMVTWSSDAPNIASVDENGFVTCNGMGSANITATADGKSCTCNVSSPEYGKVQDSEGNEYKTVKIGSQWWMSENMRATKYSPNNTESKNVTITIISSGGETAYTPYCIDARNKSNWSAPEDWDTEYDDLVPKFGYLYNWAAAVGVANGETVKTDFTGNRQGICPDGWHVPTRGDWYILISFVRESEGGISQTGKYLKSVNGWYKESEYYKPALDSYGFTILPTGQYDDKTLYSVGRQCLLWSSSLDMYDEFKAGHAWFLRCSYMSDDMSDEFSHIYGGKEKAYSVRCVKN